MPLEHPPRLALRARRYWQLLNFSVWIAVAQLNDPFDRNVLGREHHRAAVNRVDAHRGVVAPAGEVVTGLGARPQEDLSLATDRAEHGRPGAR